MKLLRQALEKDQSGTLTLIPEDGEDMWYIYNLVQEGDEVETLTSRKIVPLGKDGTPTGGGQRKLLKLRVRILKIEFDPEGSILRLNGPTAVDHDEVPAGTFHTIQIEEQRKFDLYKDEWDSYALQTAKESTNIENRSEIAAVVLQPGLAHICLITEAMTVLRLKIEKSIPRKRRGDNSGQDKALAKFLDDVAQGIERNINLDKIKVVLLAAPGNLAEDLHNHIIKTAINSGNQTILKAKSKFLVIHASSGHLHALDEALNQQSVQKQLADTRYGRESIVMDKFFKALNEDDGRAWYGAAQVEAAIEAGGVETLMLTDTLFRSNDIQERRRYIRMTEAVKDAGKEVLVFSGFHSSGEQLDSVTGVACITFYPMPELEEIE